MKAKPVRKKYKNKKQKRKKGFLALKDLEGILKGAPKFKREPLEREF